ETPSGRMLRGGLGGPGGAEILQARLEAFDAEPHGAAAGKIEVDIAGGRVSFGEANGKQLQDTIDSVGVDARHLDVADAVEMQGGALALLGLALIFPGEAVHQQRKAVVG